MNLLITKARSIALLSALAVVSTIPAAAAPLPNLGHLFNRTPANVTKPQEVVLNFHNESFEPRELHVGNDVIRLQPRRSSLVRVTVGADVHVLSPMDSHVNRTLTVTTASASQDVAIK
jgi:hypothetical protein